MVVCNFCGKPITQCTCDLTLKSDNVNFKDEFLRWKIYDKEKPRYHLFKWRKCNK